jgi:hypothetical protein
MTSSLITIYAIFFLVTFLLLIHAKPERTQLRRKLLTAKPSTKPEGRKTFGFVKKSVKNTFKAVRKPVNTVKDKIKGGIDCVKNPLKCGKDAGKNFGNGVKHNVLGGVDCVKNPLKCGQKLGDDAKDLANDAIDTAKDVAGDFLDCAKDPLACTKKNPFWGLLPDCIRTGRVDKCFDHINDDTAKDIGKYAARIQKIGSMAFWEVGGTLLQIAREANKHHMEACSNSDGKTKIPIPWGFKYKKTLPFVTANNIELPTCIRPVAWVKRAANIFKKCFLADLDSLGPKVVALWKDGDIGDEAQCEPGDNFAVILKLQMVADTKKFFASGGGGIGLAFGCKDGKLKQTMAFDYEAGVTFSSSPTPLSISLAQDVGFLTEWPSHGSDILKDLGSLRVVVGIPNAVNIATRLALQGTCEKLLPDSIKAMLCGKAFPDRLTVFVDPPKVNLNPDEPLFDGFQMVGLSLSWVMELYKTKSAAEKVPNPTKSKSLGLLKFFPRNPLKTNLFSLTDSKIGIKYGNTHIFGNLPNTSPCKGWPRYDDCLEKPCRNGASCLDQVNDYQCICTSGYTGKNCETNIDDCANKPCQNGGACVDKLSGYSCKCSDGYSGKNCETNIDDCANKPCQNGGACVDKLSGYSCKCSDGYSGKNCETNIDDCANKPCQNGGACVDKLPGYSCKCSDGYSGKNCETNIDDCANKPCQNGLCIDGIDSFICDCSGTMFEGLVCNVPKKTSTNVDSIHASGVDGAKQNENTGNMKDKIAGWKDGKKMTQGIPNNELAAKANNDGAVPASSDHSNKDDNKNWVKVSTAEWMLMTGLGFAVIAMVMYGLFVMIYSIFKKICNDEKGKQLKKSDSDLKNEAPEEDDATEVPKAEWSSYHDEHGNTYYNNGKRSTWTNHAAVVKRRSTLKPATVLEITNDE